MTWQNEELASDALKIQAYQHYEANDYGLAASYICGRPALAPAPAAGTSTAGGPEDRAPLYEQWWRDGDEPTYYIISPKVGSRWSPHLPHRCECFLKEDTKIGGPWDKELNARHLSQRRNAGEP